MLRTFLTAATAVSALAIAAAPAIAQHAPPQNSNAGGNGGMPAGAAMDARANSQGPANAAPQAMERANTNSVLQTSPVTTAEEPQTMPNPATGTSHGPEHASPTGIANANSRSVLAGDSIDMPDLRTGLTVNDSSGATIGTVSQIVTGADGAVRLVIVTSPTGDTLRLSPTTLTVSGDIVTTTSTMDD